MGWSCHRWTAFDNPSMAEKWKAEIEDLKLANPAIEQTPLFQQHYLGKWVTDDSKLVYRFDSSRNVFDELPAARHGRDRWHYVLGIDLGFNDPTAWVVCGYRDNDRTLYVLGADKKAGCDITEVADRTHKLMSRFQFDSIIIDNANKQAVEEIRRRHDIPLTPAQKQGKADFIEIMNGDFISGFIKIQRKLGVGLMDELQSLVWDERALPRREEHPGCDNHLTDALLYSWRHCYQYLADTLAPNGMRAGNTQGEWVMLEYETELEKQLEEKHYQEQQLAMWGDN
jgi:hypothetical protein